MPINACNFAVIPSSICSGHPHYSQVSPASERLSQLPNSVCYKRDLNMQVLAKYQGDG